jgi:hypothetical protein
MLPFNPDARLLAVLWPLYVIAAALVAGLALRRFVGRFLEEGDPRRQLISQAILYAGAFVEIAVSMWRSGPVRGPPRVARLPARR